MSLVTVFSLLAGMGNIVGGWCMHALSLDQARMRQVMALGAGFLMGGALFTMLPAALSVPGHSPLYIGAGYFGLLALRALLRHHHPDDAAGPSAESAWAALVGMVLHSFLDGAALGAAAHVDGSLGLVALVAIFIHKIPEGFSLAALVLSATGSRGLALWATALTCVATLMGAAAALIWAEAASLSQGALLGIAAGSFLYVGATDMVPGLIHKRESAWLILVGAALVFLLTGGHLHAHPH